jgi:hypothetical protein
MHVSLYMAPGHGVAAQARYPWPMLSLITCTCMYVHVHYMICYNCELYLGLISTLTHAHTQVEACRARLVAMTPGQGTLKPSGEWRSTCKTVIIPEVCEKALCTIIIRLCYYQ